MCYKAKGNFARRVYRILFPWCNKLKSKSEKIVDQKTVIDQQNQVLESYCQKDAVNSSIQKGLSVF